MRLALTVLAFASLTSACSTETSTSFDYGYNGYREPRNAAVTRPPPPKEVPGTLSQPTVAPPAKEGAFAEVVYVLMRDTAKRQWFCTGTLVSSRTVVTAAHCLDAAQFVSYEIVAPNAATKPRVAATTPTVFGGSYEHVANPDIGFLELATPIAISAYPELTDVGPKLEAGEPVTAAAMVRVTEKPEAALAMSWHLTVSSTAEFGYEHGLGTPRFTNGGDSGAGLFLVENGKVTHKLIGVARQPEPARQLDHFTRVSAGFIDWYKEAVSP